MSFTQNPLNKELHDCYYYKPNLLIQFVFFEYLKAYRESRKLIILSSQIKSNAEIIHSSPLTHAMIADAYHSLSNLTTPKKEKVILPPWKVRDGSLDKLKNFSDIMIEQKFLSPELAAKIYDLVEKAWFLSRELLLSVEMLKSTKTTKNILRLCPKFESIGDHIQKLSKQFNPLMQFFIDDENVHLFILRYRKLFDELLGESFLQDFQKKSQKQLAMNFQSLIVEKYNSRGFKHIVQHLDQNG